MQKRVLIIDDEVAFLFALKKMLQNERVEVDTAETADQAVQFLGRLPYDAVIADIRLTGSGSQEGLQILGYVKDKYPESRVILMTGYGNPEVMQEAYSLGADYYFEKPVPVQLITDALTEIGLPV